MKGLSIKKLAAVAAGAALVGSALLPIVTAAASDLTKTDIYSDGTPAVNIVVGASAAVSDVVWAGNIAAAVARNAVTTAETTGTPTPSSCGGAGSWGAPSGLKATIVVGGTTKITGGARELITALMNNKVNTAEYIDTVGNAYFTSFKNGSLTAKKGTDTNSVTETESVGVKIDAGFDTTHTDVKDMVAVINNGDLNYVADFGTGVAACGYTDSGSSDYIPINFLGKAYTVDQVNSDCTQVEIVTATAEKTMVVGDTIDIDGRTTGTKYKFKLLGGSTKSDGTYQAQIELQDANGTVLQSQQFTASTTSDITFYDSAGTNLISTRVTLKSIAKQSVASSDVWSFTMLVGSDRITIKNGQRFPYDPNNTTGTYPWTGTITLGAGSNGIANSMVAQLVVKNQAKVWDATNPLYSKTYSLKTTGTSEAGILEGSGLDTIGTVEFKGFYDSGVQKTTLKFLPSGADVSGQATPYGNLDYYDASSVNHKIPYAMKLASVGYGSGTFTFEGQVYNFRAGATPVAGTSESSISLGDGNVWFKSGSTIGSGTAVTISDSNYTVDGNSGNNQWGNPGDIDANFSSGTITGKRSTISWGYSPVLTLTGRNSKTYYYALKATASGLWLTLTGHYDTNAGTYYTGKIDDLQWSAGTVWLLGTDYDDANGVQTRALDSNNYLQGAGGATGANAVNGGLAAGEVLPYYAPDLVEFGANPGTTSGVFKTAVFKVKPIATGSTIPDYSSDAQRGYTIYVDTADHKIVDTANISKTNYSGKLTGIDYNSDIGGTRDYNLNNLSEYTGSSAAYTQAYDANGNYVKLANRELTMTVPNAAMKAYVIVKSKDVTQEVSGETLEVAKGESKTTTGGTKVDVTDLTYTAGMCGGDANAQAVSCSAVTSSSVASGYGNLVVTDSSAGAGRHIIVGGWKVNKLAQDLDLEAELTAAGDAVVDVTDDGDVVVAGYTASDTGNAAKALIAALDAGLA